MGSLKITFPRAALFVRDAFKVLCIVREGCCVASLGGIQSATAGYNVLFSAVASSSEVTLTPPAAYCSLSLARRAMGLFVVSAGPKSWAGCKM